MALRPSTSEVPAHSALAARTVAPMAPALQPRLDGAKLASARARIDADDRLLRLARVRATAEELRDLLLRVPADPQLRGRRRIGAIELREVEVIGELVLADLACGRLELDSCQFDGGLTLRNVQVDREAFLINSTCGHLEIASSCFDGELKVRATAISHRAVFGHSVYRDVHLRKVTVGGHASFTRAFVRGTMGIWESRFEVAVSFNRVTVLGPSAFEGTTFGGWTSFSEAWLLDDAGFSSVRFEHETNFSSTAVLGCATFAATTFAASRQLGLLLAASIDLRGAIFAQPIRVEVATRRLQLDRADFQRGADLYVRQADVTLDDTSFSGPALLAGLSVTSWSRQRQRFVGCDEIAHDGAWSCPRVADPSPNPEPRLLSLRGAKVSQLTLSGVDMRACHFAGAHGLDALQIESGRFRRAPSGWHVRWRRLHWTRRQTIAEEHDWRTHHGHGDDWHLEGDFPRALAPEQIAALYRALRKGREDRKDEPGAADFYYGEMEMRRQAGWMSAAQLSDEWVPAPRSTRVLLGLYWLVSGYGLRASRALISLAVTVALLALPLDLWGFRADRAYGRSLLFAAESSVSLLRAPTIPLTASGEVVQLVLRIVGPLLFGLAALSLRGRVKR